MNTNPWDEIPFFGALVHFFMAPFRLRTYTNLLYLLLAMPLGLIYFIFLTVGLSTGFGLLIVWIGIPLLAIVFAGSWGLAALERQLAIHALGADVPPMSPPQPLPGTEPSSGFWPRIKAFLANPVTWKGMAFLLLKLPLGVVTFGITVTLLATSGALMLAPLAGQLYNFEIDGVYLTLDSLGSAWICATVGLSLFVLSLNLLNGLALIWRWTAAFLLGSERFVPAAPAPPVLPITAAA